MKLSFARFYYYSLLDFNCGVCVCVWKKSDATNHVVRKCRLRTVIYRYVRMRNCRVVKMGDAVTLHKTISCSELRVQRFSLGSLCSFGWIVFPPSFQLNIKLGSANLDRFNRLAVAICRSIFLHASWSMHEPFQCSVERLEFESKWVCNVINWMILCVIGSSFLLSHYNILEQRFSFHAISFRFRGMQMRRIHFHEMLYFWTGTYFVICLMSGEHNDSFDGQTLLKCEENGFEKWKMTRKIVVCCSPRC